MTTKTLEQYVLKNKKYELVTKSKSGEVSSEALKGLNFPVTALFSRVDNYATIKDILKQ